MFCLFLLLNLCLAYVKGNKKMALETDCKGELTEFNACYHSVQSLLSSRLLSRNVKVKMCKTIILPVVLYGCETWSVTLREEHRLRVFENRVLRRIFGPKRDEVTGEWRTLHNEELHSLYSSPDIIRQVKSTLMRWARHVARMGEERKVYNVLVGKPEGKRPLGRPRRRWEDGIRMDLREIGLGRYGLDSTDSGQRPVVGCGECGDEPSGSCAKELVGFSF
jgi:hypothetical protein